MGERKGKNEEKRERKIKRERERGARPAKTKVSFE